ncbi:hypothetical protein J4460_08860 [Candidatus Woesearchaeota archaeon]|nr:MAG: hypothetical protein QS99_C0014G0012 [archaeon GW2011_AR4]MBS3130747.1 hypothetical protein [Candidatus Woesearchaeota archaeon]HIH38388.1 hypothetical protein [Candidatus Woesearchaeota archaeon]HIH49625.1 hypothetical protein [Candidatus Woesearchaeota archaeon]HIJ03080.1 hypothetical protein [Candidatus Woesearchaeota archaeon]
MRKLISIVLLVILASTLVSANLYRTTCGLTYKDQQVIQTKNQFFPYDQSVVINRGCENTIKYSDQVVIKRSPCDQRQYGRGVVVASAPPFDYYSQRVIERGRCTARAPFNYYNQDVIENTCCNC